MVGNTAPASYLCWRQPLDVDRALANLGQVVIHLHPEPGVRGATDGFFKLYSHFRRDSAASRNQIVKLLPRDTEALCCGDNRNVDIVERVADQLARGGWIFHLHFFLAQGEPTRSTADALPPSNQKITRQFARAVTAQKPLSSPFNGCPCV